MEGDAEGYARRCDNDRRGHNGVGAVGRHTVLIDRPRFQFGNREEMFGGCSTDCDIDPLAGIGWIDKAVVDIPRLFLIAGYP